MPELSLSEILSRFVLNKRYIRSNNTVRWNAFLPDKNGETSVFRTSGISNNEIWDIGEREVAVSQEKPMLGRADISVDDVFKKGLEVVPHEPPEKHANIIGWPNIKSKQRLIALELESEAHFYKK